MKEFTLGIIDRYVPNKDAEELIIKLESLSQPKGVELNSIKNFNNFKSLMITVLEELYKECVGVKK